MLLNLYWSVLILLVGACVGSFLNVVIYRWPRDLSLRRPLWSFCPHCRATLTWKDNVPIVGWVLLRGRCRHCAAPISRQYPLVEAATALAFLIVFDALFAARLRTGIGELSRDWPMLLAHWALAAGLITLAVMDLEAYMVDIRVTWIVSAVGLAAHTLWTPWSSLHDGGWLRPGALGASVVIAGTVGLILGALLFLRREPEPTGPAPENPAEASGSPPEAAAEPASAPLYPPPSRAWLLMLTPLLLVLAYIALIGLDDYQQWQRMTDFRQPISAALFGWLTPEIRVLMGFGVVYLAVVAAAAHPHPEEDREIVDAIAEEAPDARRNAFSELKLLAPAIILALLAGYLVWNPGPVRDAASRLLAWEPLSDWKPLMGLATGLAGWFIGGAVGWSARVIFTLGLGKEALGIGDVHILAATGAVAGWMVAFLGFFVAAPLALVALVVIHLRRQSRALPYGPWLALGFLAAVLFQDRILAHLGIRWMLE